METTKPLITELTSKVKQASLLWIEGFTEACCFHRAIILCLRSRKVLIRTGQCFLLNGFIFLGSIFVLYSVVIPTLQWILPDEISNGNILKFYSYLRSGLVQLFYVFWFYPMYAFSYFISTLWNNEIAKFGYAAMGRTEPNIAGPTSQNNTSNNSPPTEKPAGLGGVMIGIGEQVYSILLLTLFFIEANATGFIPYIGKALNFVLLSWIYAYYCFEYKWNYSEVALDRRIDFFESNWAFFAGFGSPCILPIFFFSSLVSYGLMAILYPLFVLTATSTECGQEIFVQRTKWKGVGLGRIPIFYAADTVTMRILSFIPLSKWEARQEHNKVL